MFTTRDIVVRLEASPEDIPIRENFINSGDENFDQKCEEDIIAQLDSGNDWAWCIVKLTVIPKKLIYTEEIFGTSYLGGCSFQNEEEFAQSDYYKDMIDWALEDLNNKSKNIYECLKDKFASTED